MAIIDNIRKVSDTVWELPVTHKEGMRVPARIIATEKLVRDMDEAVYEQISNAKRFQRKKRSRREVRKDQSVNSASRKVPMETERNPNEPAKPTSPGQEGGQRGGGKEQGDRDKQQGGGGQERDRDRDKQGGGGQQGGGQQSGQR